ncbi:MAG: transcriptional regulator [Planctomycetes bacterium RIFCSPHIGHO2_12_39_6]|nr:MAG: transcriptional regulator [Planctomycetes bacterium RIFCSPLOWO2_12_38_17]OHC02419.1 MAG: transcriptional regulator [Planctomycetes bacterium RIFCSPHIGHO2_12_39_6]
MKKVTAIIREDRFSMVKDALSDIGYPGMTVTEVKGHGNQKGVTEQWRGRTYRTDLLKKTQIEIVVSDKDVEKILQCIVKESQTGSIGDGKIFISPIENAVRIRTGEKGEAAV